MGNVSSTPYVASVSFVMQSVAVRRVWHVLLSYEIFFFLCKPDLCLSYPSPIFNICQLLIAMMYDWTIDKLGEPELHGINLRIHWAQNNRGAGHYTNSWLDLMPFPIVQVFSNNQFSRNQYDRNYQSKAWFFEYYPCIEWLMGHIAPCLKHINMHRALSLTMYLRVGTREDNGCRVKVSE